MNSQEPTPAECRFAMLAHGSGIFFPVLGPLAVFILQSKSRFARYHALHAFVGTLVLNLFLFIFGAISITISLIGLYNQYQQNFENFEWWPIILKSVITWVILGLIALANLIMNVSQALRANSGQWPMKGMTTSIVNRILGKPSQFSADALS